MNNILKEGLDIQKIYNVATRYYRAALKRNNSKEFCDFIQNYGFDENTIKRFNLGYATNDNNALYQLLISLDFSTDEIILSGLVKKDNQGNYYDTFRNRLIIPIASVDGGFVSFCGRSINNSNPKYIQLSDTTLCKKNEQVFGLNIAKNNNSKLILCEGFIDVIKMHQVGFTNTISICGFEMSKTQLALINKYADQVLLLYDNDEFGQKMQKQVARLFDEYGIKYTTPHFGKFDYNDSVDMVLELLNKGYKRDEILRF